MRIKRLEIQGFKSFKDKTIIHFDHTITGIVGPNGCGKSNVVDAFFWVMGEQSYKHMRGSGSGDLIFNGSTKYSPLGMAEATLVMETDVPDTANGPAGASVADIPVHLKSKEVSVTRRVYRDGEGEYLINGVQARLKDIHELFMDTGAGAKGYSIIEQGQIARVVTAKPEERRLLIEEAAGIAKYKARKKESLRKMEAAQANLSRLNDVITEIERNLGSLERQAQKARQAKKIQEELLEKEMTWGRRKNRVFRQKIEALLKQRESLEQELIGLRAELAAAEARIETDRVEQVTDTKSAEETQARIQSLASDLSHAKSQLDLSRRRQGDLAQQLENFQAEREELTLAITTKREEIVGLETEATSAESVFGEAAERARSMDEHVRQMRRSADDARRELENANRELMSGIAQASDLTSRAAALSGRTESALQQAERLRVQSQTANEKVGGARVEVERSQASATETREKRDQLQAERKEQAARVQEQESTLRLAERERELASRGLMQLRSRLESLEELAAAHEGMGDGPKAALEWASSKGGRGKIRAVADTLEVSRGYENALEGWLEGRLESLISEDPELAFNAINEIREKKEGRASIFVAAIPPTKAAEFLAVRKILEAAGFTVEGELAEFVKTEHPITRRLIANVAVVESLREMVAFFAAQGSAKGSCLSQLGGWSVVAKDGSALDFEGNLRGGSSESNASANILGRKRAIAELTEQVTDSAAKFAVIEQEIQDQRQAIELARGRANSIATEAQQLEVQLSALDRDVIQFNRALKDAQSQLELNELEIQELNEEANRAREERARIDSKLGEFTARRTELETKIEEERTAVETRENEVRSEEAQLQQVRVNEAYLRERSGSLKRELEASRGLIVDRERRLGEVNRVLDRATNERGSFMSDDAGLITSIEELTHALAAQQDLLSAIKETLAQKQGHLDSLLSRIKSLHKTGDEKTSEANLFEIEAARLQGDLQHLLQNLEEKYGPGCLNQPSIAPIQEEMEDPIVTAEMSEEEERQLGEEVERLRERRRRLGEVNPEAIDEFEKQQLRFEHLVTERGDLQQSITNLEEAIDHINQTSEERFKKAFEAIADRFEKLFPIIFGGGRAKLTLSLPEGSTDVLDAGVDILAQPPGKAITNITALSGGEKALTAVSLIFAIFMVKPSPFCVLDEVDAPLDDANVGRFNALLREMSVKTQFILITHNKKTMELNDTLYGVTMEEPGVSKMVSIELQ